ncbi:LOW QUALITY PROTEIN: transcription cofactor HES-6-like [Coturnix japonica]|uniref:LOW QUALITY PROTEIN: transcription cofactor HES-6-like n=1 Tax=Coturnix japonica TaxID=93934 RepID=UPI0013A5E1C0|nr:LOW QUALITY PROTEIN: transcription cofactor HES-6-like [Coturnix japonica]
MLLFGSVCWGNCSCQLSSASSYRTKPRQGRRWGAGGGTTPSHGTARHHTASHGISRHHTASHGTARHHTAPHSIARHHTASYSTARPRTTRLVAHPHGPAADKAPGRHWAVQPTLRRCPHRAANGRTAMQSGRYKTGRCGAGSGAGPRSSAAGMAPSCRHGKGRAPRGGADGRGSGAERGGRGASADGAVCPRARKPLVEKKRRARINESLRELRQLLAGGEAKLENAEVLELTVRRVQAVLERRALEGGRLHREASERFAAGYIQCMHEVHTFVSGCPGIDGTTAAELLNHLLESMPLNEGGLRDLMADVLAESWPGGEAALPPAEAALGPVLPAPSAGDETCSDSDEAEAEPGRTPAHGLEAAQTRGVSPAGSNKSMWRPW